MGNLIAKYVAVGAQYVNREQEISRAATSSPNMRRTAIRRDQWLRPSKRLRRFLARSPKRLEAGVKSMIVLSPSVWATTFLSIPKLHSTHPSLSMTRVKYVTYTAKPTPGCRMSIGDTWDKEKYPLFPVAKTRIGNLGSYICNDGMTPEPCRQTAFNGTEVMYHPELLMDPWVIPPLEYFELQTRWNSVVNTKHHPTA